MARRILVTGATGKLGKRVVERLLKRNSEVRILTRRPEEARRLWGDAVEVAQGDFADPFSLKEALVDIDALFLLSPISEALASHQNAAVDAAAFAGIGRIVKISGSDWTIRNADRSVSGSAHALVEAYLTESGVAHTILRPNAWMQVALEPTIAAILSREDLPDRYSGAAVSYIDVDDIADVSVAALTKETPLNGAFVLTGGKALTALEIGRIAARILHRPIGVSQTVRTPLPLHPGAFEQKAVGEFGVLIAEGLASSLSDDVRRITGREPRTVDAYLSARLAGADIPTHNPKGEKSWH
ncbi:NAD(P)H-binding protein [Agrobacterium sp. NPDC090273]|uniref:NAD(P)H-binding protein n=1 Tax=Agrobacterium sp. NPDC090273 TaxID=3363919 RepID=UPI00383B981A